MASLKLSNEFTLNRRFQLMADENNSYRITFFELTYVPENHHGDLVLEVRAYYIDTHTLKCHALRLQDTSSHGTLLYYSFSIQWLGIFGWRWWKSQPQRQTPSFVTGLWHCWIAFRGTNDIFSANKVLLKTGLCLGHEATRGGCCHMIHLVLTELKRLMVCYSRMIIAVIHWICSSQIWAGKAWYMNRQFSFESRGLILLWVWALDSVDTWIPGWKLGGIIVQVAEIWNPLEYMSEAACVTNGGFQRGWSGITCARTKIAHWVAAVLTLWNSSRNTAQVKCRFDTRLQEVSNLRGVFLPDNSVNSIVHPIY